MTSQKQRISASTGGRGARGGGGDRGNGGGGGNYYQGKRPYKGGLGGNIAYGGRGSSYK